MKKPFYFFVLSTHTHLWYNAHPLFASFMNEPHITQCQPGFYRIAHPITGGNAEETGVVCKKFSNGEGVYPVEMFATVSQTFYQFYQRIYGSNLNHRHDAVCGIQEKP